MTATPAPTLRCDVAGLRHYDLETVGALARLALVVRRRGYELRLVGVPPRLAELIALAGLDGALLGVEMRRQPEEREEALGVEEERQLGGAAGCLPPL